MHRQVPTKVELGALLSFLPYLGRHKRSLALASALMLVGAAGAMTFPYASRLAIDNYIVPRKPQGLLWLVALIAGLMFLSNLANAYRIRLMARVGQESIRRIRLDLFRHLQHLPVAYFDKTPVGKVMTRLTSDVDALAELLSGSLIQMGGDLLTMVGFLLIMILVDWRLALVTMAGLPPLVFAFTFLRGRIQRAEDEARERASTVNATLQEDVSGIRVIQSFWAGRQFTARFEEANQALLRAGLRAVFIFAFFWPIVDFAWVAGAGLILLYGGYRVLEGTLTIGVLAACIGYSGQFFGPLHGLSQAFRVIQRALAGAVRIKQILDQSPEDLSGLPAMPPIEGRVEFVGTTFAYDEGRPVLTEIDLVAEPGAMVALVGRTGAGKTSLVNLLCRFYRPQAGRILVDGIDINTTDLESYRRQVALVLQEPFLFAGTIRENLRYGRNGASDAEMEAALAAAGLADTLAAQDMNLDTVLHERGGNLSSGQRQLLAFARAILADPRLIILDEATAHVDTITERKVQAAMASLLARRTAFVIAHRLSTIQAADRILLIEDGRIAERGSHAELIAARGRYWRLCCEQNLFTRGELDLPEEEPAAGE
ncbi:MAG: ABC transporter ATP-binding protein [Bacteroidota bacterium]